MVISFWLLAFIPSYEIGFDLISEYIDSHYFEELTVEKLAAMCNMSHSTFSMNFYRRYNMTCKEYITATRINAAEKLLFVFPATTSRLSRGSRLYGLQLLLSAATKN